ncbi:unnamed protein product, partial [Nesidiocoris tenuis]
MVFLEGHVVRPASGDPFSPGGNKTRDPLGSFPPGSADPSSYSPCVPGEIACLLLQNSRDYGLALFLVWRENPFHPAGCRTADSSGRSLSARHANGG